MLLSDYTGPGAALACYPSESSPRTYFIVQSDRDGSVVYCTCPGWTTSKKNPKMCKHLTDWQGNNERLAGLRRRAILERFWKATGRHAPLGLTGSSFAILEKNILAFYEDAFTEGLNAGLGSRED